MTDYSQLSDDQLDLEIAKRRGLNVHTSAENGGDKDMFGGREHIHGEWEDLWYIDDEGLPETLPRWSRSLNATTQLNIYMGYLQLDLKEHKVIFHLAYGVYHTLRAETETASGMARAVCIAFLMHTDEVPTSAMLAAQAAR